MRIFLPCMLVLYADLMAQVINIESKRFVKDTNGFTGKSDFFFSANQNQVLLISLGANVHTQYRYYRHRWLGIVDYAYTKAGEAPFVNNGFLHLRYNFKITRGIYAEGFAQAQYNLLIFLDQRLLCGSGFRLHLHRKENSGVFYGISYLYEYQLMNRRQWEFYFHRGSTYLSFFRRFPWTEVSGTVYYQPVLTHFNIYRFSGDIQWEFLPGKPVNFLIVFSGFYDELRPPGIPFFIYTSRSVLRIRFR